MSLVEHAKRELELAGLFDADSDYEGMIGKAVLELIEVFAKQGHSGMSARATMAAFAKIANYEPLTPLTDDPAEWTDVSDDEGVMFQSRRRPDAFSKDGGKTYYLLGDPNQFISTEKR